MIGVALDAVVVPVVILTVVSVVCASIAEVDDGNGDDRVGAECRLVTLAGHSHVSVPGRDQSVNPHPSMPPSPDEARSHVYAT